jgi:protoporphyrin/coproporphyrin ferrochelatase
MADRFDAILLVSFGGPESRDDVLPFLENVLRGRNVPLQRMLEVAEHYYHFGGISPINAQNRALISALTAELEVRGPKLPIYFGNRNWRPLLPDTIRQMAKDGIRRAVAIFTSAFSSYSGCRQYLENIDQARQTVGPAAPSIEKVRGYFNHPGFIAAMIDRANDAMAAIPEVRRLQAELVFTAHSIPISMATSSNYVRQLSEASSLVAKAISSSERWQLAYQSRSGPPEQPWLEPDVCDVLRALAADKRTSDVVVVPIGFLSDHMEVLYDLDVEAVQLAGELGLNLFRAGTVGVHPAFVRALRDLIAERVENLPSRPTIGALGALPDICPTDCCPAPRRPR